MLKIKNSREVTTVDNEQTNEEANHTFKIGTLSKGWSSMSAITHGKSLSRLQRSLSPLTSVKKVETSFPSQNEDDESSNCSLARSRSTERLDVCQPDPKPAIHPFRAALIHNSWKSDIGISHCARQLQPTPLSARLSEVDRRTATCLSEEKYCAADASRPADQPILSAARTTATTATERQADTESTDYEACATRGDTGDSAGTPDAPGPRERPTPRRTSSGASPIPLLAVGRDGARSFLRRSSMPSATDAAQGAACPPLPSPPTANSNPQPGPATPKTASAQAAADYAEQTRQPTTTAPQATAQPPSPPSKDADSAPAGGSGLAQAGDSPPGARRRPHSRGPPRRRVSARKMIRCAVAGLRVLA